MILINEYEYGNTWPHRHIWNPYPWLITNILNHPNESWVGLITQITNPIGIDYSFALHEKLCIFGVLIWYTWKIIYSWGIIFDCARMLGED